MSTNNNTNKWNKPLGILLCLGVLAGLIYLSYSNQKKAEEFGKVIEKHYNVSLPSNLLTKQQKLAWFCKTYKLSSEGCEALSNIESKIAAGRMIEPKGFDIKTYDKWAAESIAGCKSFSSEYLNAKIEIRRTAHIVVSSLASAESWTALWQKYAGHTIYCKFEHPFCSNHY